MAKEVVFNHIIHHKIHAYPSDAPGTSAAYREESRQNNQLLHNLSLMLCGTGDGEAAKPSTQAPVSFKPHLGFVRVAHELLERSTKGRQKPKVK